MQTMTRRAFLALAAAIIATAAAPQPAEATPREFRKCPSVTQNGITYLLHQRAAIVTRCPARRSVTIPHSVRHAGKVYTVRAIWPGAISATTARLVIKARELETIEDVSIWRRKDLTIICSDAGTREWLRSGSRARIR